MSSTSLGFRVPPEDAIRLIDYSVLLDGQPLGGSEDQTTSISWSPQSTVALSFELDVDLEAVLLKTGFKVEVDPPKLGAAINWKSTRTGLHGAVGFTELTDGINSIEASLGGSELGGVLQLKLAVILLDSSPANIDPLAPSKPGSRLWEASLKVQLEGDGSQFPTSAFDFKEVGYDHPDAMWRLNISDAIENHISSTVRLNLNTGHPRVAEYVTEPSSEKNEEFHRFLRMDITKQLLIFALQSDTEQLRINADEDGTLASTLLEIHNTYFPTSSIESTKDIFLYDPGIVSSAVQSVIFRKKK